MVKDLTRGGPTRLIISFAMTMLIGNMMSYIYNFTDSIMVGWFVNTDALGAVSSVSAIAMVLNNLSASVVGAFSIVAGRIFGAGDRTELRKMMASATWLTVGITAVITVASLLLCKPLIVWTETPEELADMAYTYMFIIILAKPLAAPTWLLGGIFRALGDTKTPLYISLVNGFGNVVFNFIFLYVFPLGIAGAALGTLCSTLTGSILYLIVFKKKMKMLHFGRGEARPEGDMVRQLLRIGVPIGLEAAVTSFGSMILQAAINFHGASAVTGIALGNKIMSLFWIFFGVFDSALLCFCAQNLGAGKLPRVKRGIKNTLLIDLGMGAAVLLFVLVALDRFVYAAFAVQESCAYCASFDLSMLFSLPSDACIGCYAHTYLLTQLLFFPCIAVLFVRRAGLKAFGATFPTLACGVIELAARLTVSVFFKDNVQMLFFAGPMAWIASSLFVAILYPIVLRRFARQMKKHESVQEISIKEGATGQQN